MFLPFCHATVFIYSPISGSFESSSSLYSFTRHGFGSRLLRYLTCSDSSNTLGEHYESQYDTNFGRHQAIVCCLLLLWFSCHVFLSTALYLEPPFTPSKIENILNYSHIPPLEEIESKAFANIDRRNYAKVMYNLINAEDIYNDTEISQPNLIAEIFPDDFTGVINGTYAVLPIDYELARSIIPRRYRILDAGIRRLLPSLPGDKYPVRSILHPS